MSTDMTTASRDTSGDDIARQMAEMIFNALRDARDGTHDVRLVNDSDEFVAQITVTKSGDRITPVDPQRPRYSANIIAYRYDGDVTALGRFVAQFDAWVSNETPASVHVEWKDGWIPVRLGSYVVRGKDRLHVMDRCE